MRAGRYAEAERDFRVVLQSAPAHSLALENLGILALQRQNPTEAIALLSRAASLAPERATALYNLGTAHIAAFHFQAAKECLLKAIKLKPAFAEAHNNLGNLHKYLGEPDAAIRYCAQALALAPNNVGLHSNYLVSLHFSQSSTAEEFLRQHQAWAERHAKKHYPRGKCFSNTRDPERRLKLGFVSSKFNGNIVGRLLRPVFSALDRNNFSIHCYSNTLKEDTTTEELRAAAETWTPIQTLEDSAAAKKIEGDGIDILFDLCGHVPDNRLLIFARRPAPVQVTWLDYFDTTGIETMDYILSDPVTTPPGSPQRFVEQVLCLPTRLCWSPPQLAPDVAARDVTGKLRFGSFGRLDKLNPDTIELWASIINATDASLLLKSRAFSIPELCRHVLAQFAARGVAAERIELRGPSPYPQLLKEYGDIDVALDTHPYSGGATSADALWMGVPVITLSGDCMISRQTAAMLHCVGLDSFVAEDPKQYLEIAIRSSAQRDRLAEIRAGLRSAMQNSALANADIFTQSFAACLRTIWRRWSIGY